eukprot:1628484-Rhodomonas_salina.4
MHGALAKQHAPLFLGAALRAWRPEHSATHVRLRASQGGYAGRWATCAASAATLSLVTLSIALPPQPIALAAFCMLSGSCGQNWGIPPAGGAALPPSLRCCEPLKLGICGKVPCGIPGRVGTCPGADDRENVFSMLSRSITRRPVSEGVQGCRRALFPLPRPNTKAINFALEVPNGGTMCPGGAGCSALLHQHHFDAQISSLTFSSHTCIIVQNNKGRSRAGGQYTLREGTRTLP